MIPVFFGFIPEALATETTDTIASTTGGVLSESVQAIITTGVNFLETNLPLIVVLGVAVGMVFWLIRKSVRAIRGRG